MALKRNKIEVIYDILNSIKEKNNKIKITHILYKANLSHIKLKEYIEELEKNDLISKYDEKKHVFYSLTPKGEEYVQRLKQMKKFMDTFDI